MIDVEFDWINSAVSMKLGMEHVQRKYVIEQMVYKISRYQELSHTFPSFFPKIKEVSTHTEGVIIHLNSSMNKVLLTDILKLPKLMQECKINEIFNLIISIYTFQMKCRVEAIDEDLVFICSIEDVFNYLVPKDGNDYHKVSFDCAIKFYVLFLEKLYHCHGFLYSSRFFLTKFFFGVNFSRALSVLPVSYVKIFLSIHSLISRKKYALFFLFSLFIYFSNHFLHASYLNKYLDGVSYLTDLIEVNDAYISGRIVSTNVFDVLESKIAALDLNASLSSYFRIKIAHVYFNQRNLERTIDLLKPLSYIRNDSNSLEAAYLKAFAYYQIGSLSDAESTYNNIFSVGYGSNEFIIKNQVLTLKISTSFALLLYELGDIDGSIELVKSVFPDIKELVFNRLDTVSSFELRRLTSSLSDVCLIFIYTVDTKSSECTKLLLSMPSQHAQQKLFSKLLRTYSLFIDRDLKLAESFWGESDDNSDFYSSRHLDQAILLSSLFLSYDLNPKFLNNIIEKSLSKKNNKVFLTNTTLYLRLANPKKFECDLISERYNASAVMVNKNNDNVRIVNAWLRNNFGEIIGRCFE